MESLKQYKNHIAIILFFCCLGGAVYNTYQINDNFNKDYIEQSKEYTNDEYESVNDFDFLSEVDKTEAITIDLSTENKNDYYLLNVIYFLFLGSLIYGKIDWD